MPIVNFTPNLQRHVDCPALHVEASCVIDALAEAFKKNPSVKSYVVDEQNRLRHHIVVFVNGVPIKDRDSMLDSISCNDEVFVFQALSGG